MNFTFCDEIKTYLKENKTITISINCDYKLFEYVKNEINDLNNKTNNILNKVEEITLEYLKLFKEKEVLN